MTDTRTPEQRRQIMQAVKTRDTGPERTVRRIVYALGYRYRLNVKALPGRPDLVVARRKQAIFVHGCFWHGHGCTKGKAPKSRLEYWAPKLKANRERDAAQQFALEKLGWSVLTIWQCETHEEEALAAKLEHFLGGIPNSASRAAQIG
jgi:DNA mismatch endonuclease (patch repair protein)